MDKFSLRNRLALLCIVLIIPFSLVTIILLYNLNDIVRKYDGAVKNVTTASGYSLTFKESLDASMYQMVARNLHKDEVEMLGMDNPEMLILSVKGDFGRLRITSSSSYAAEQCRSILNLLDSLSTYVNEIDKNADIMGSYNDNMQSLDNNVRVLTALIQEKISDYVYYESLNMEALRVSMEEKRAMYLRLFPALLIVLLGATVMLSIGIVRSIARPVEEMVRVTGEVGAGNFDARVAGRATSELKILTDSVNSMAGQIADLMEQTKEEQQRMRELELALLQEQINPHFLYNTLDNILWLAEGDQKEDVAAIVTALSRFFRTGLSGGADLIRIEEECSHIRAYLEIQQFRYRDILDYEIDIPAEYYDYGILRMTLQPIVENALYHGIKKRRKKGTISVGIKRAGADIVLFVSDDGVGMTAEELRELQRKCDAPDTMKKSGGTSGFGLVNVSERIKLRYGSGYGLTFYGAPGEGTAVEIRIPAEGV